VLPNGKGSILLIGIRPRWLNSGGSEYSEIQQFLSDTV